MIITFHTISQPTGPGRGPGKHLDKRDSVSVSFIGSRGIRSVLLALRLVLGALIIGHAF